MFIAVPPVTSNLDCLTKHDMGDLSVKYGMWEPCVPVKEWLGKKSSNDETTTLLQTSHTGTSLRSSWRKWLFVLWK